MAREIAARLPPGLQLISALTRKQPTRKVVKALVLVLTFFAYASYHAARKPPSIVKSVLNGVPSTSAASGTRNESLTAGVDLADELNGGGNEGWAPFNSQRGTVLLGNIDLAFLSAYAAGMFVSGQMGDRMDLRLFLAGGMVASGVMACMFGLAYFLDIHNLPFFVLVQLLAGFVQASGWPAVVAVMARWFGHGSRGLVMGVWNAHTSVGNVLGSVTAAAALTAGWGWSFVLPGLAMVVMAAIVYLLLVPDPAALPAVAAGSPRHRGHVDAADQATLLAPPADAPTSPRAKPAHGVRLMTAWRIPGVAPYALSLFFSKLVAYTFLYWLPFYIEATPIRGRPLSPSQAGNLSVVFDVGGVFGGALAGYLSDVTSASALVASGFTYLSLPMLYLYRTYGHLSQPLNVALMAGSGFLVNAPYALITTAVSADLGMHESLGGSERALATVAAIIDGMGSVGAALGPMLAGLCSASRGGFDNVFVMLYGAALAAAMLLSQLACKELGELAASRSTRATGRGARVLHETAASHRSLMELIPRATVSLELHPRTKPRHGSQPHHHR